MNVILLENIRNLGQLGDQVSVKNGYGRNFLIPEGKAVRATDDNIRYFQERRKELEQKAEDRLSEAKAKAEKLANICVELAARAGDEGKLFGSIGVRELAIAITAKGIEVKKSAISLPTGPIRSIGEYEIQVALHSDVEANVKVRIVEDK